jgi:hypothetical protein
MIKLDPPIQEFFGKLNPSFQEFLGKLNPSFQEFLGKLERLTSTDTNFGFSFTRLFLLKIRVITEYSIRLALNRKFFQYRELKSLHKSNSDPIIVFANGPSLNIYGLKQYLDLQLRGYKFFAVNSFALSELGKRIRPNYYVLSDPGYLRRVKDASDPLTFALNSYGESLVLFVPSYWPQISTLNCKIVKFNDFSLFGLSKNVKVWKPRGYSSLTAYKALALALHLTKARVGIIGFDNTEFHFLKSDSHNNSLLIPGEDRHFFKQESEIIDISNLYPNGVGDIIYTTSLVFASLRNFPIARVINLDENSLVDVFKKIPLSSFAAEIYVT